MYTLRASNLQTDNMFNAAYKFTADITKWNVTSVANIAKGAARQSEGRAP
jgi:hypothetical protein